jgi:hypothetical protein
MKLPAVWAFREACIRPRPSGAMARRADRLNRISTGCPDRNGEPRTYGHARGQIGRTHAEEYRRGPFGGFTAERLILLGRFF